MKATMHEYTVLLEHRLTGMTMEIRGLSARDAVAAQVIAPHATARPRAWRVKRVHQTRAFLGAPTYMRCM